MLALTGILFQLLAPAFLKMNWGHCLVGKSRILSSCPRLPGNTLQPKVLHLSKQHSSQACKRILKPKYEREIEFTLDQWNGRIYCVSKVCKLGGCRMKNFWLYEHASNANAYKLNLVMLLAEIVHDISREWWLKIMTLLIHVLKIHFCLVPPYAHHYSDMCWILVRRVIIVDHLKMHWACILWRIRHLYSIIICFSNFLNTSKIPPCFKTDPF